MLNERKLTERELDKRAEAIQGLLSNKRTLVKKYGKDAEKVMYGIATKQAKNKIEDMNKDKLKELIQAALQNEETSTIDTGFSGRADYGEEDKALGQEDELEMKGLEEGHGLDQGDIDALQNFVDRAEVKDRKIKNILKFIIKSNILQDKTKDLSKGKVDEALNPEVTKAVNRFIKAMAKRYSYSEKDAVFAIQAALKQRKFDGLNEDLDVGHQDNEPHMLKKELARAGQMIQMLYRAVDKYDGEGEVDFPQWWQAKIIKANAMLDSAFDYLDGEEMVAKIDAVIDVIDEDISSKNYAKGIEVIKNTLSKEGGAAGLEPLVKELLELGFKKEDVVKLLKSMTSVKQHRDGDYILLPLEEGIFDQYDALPNRGNLDFNDVLYLRGEVADLKDEIAQIYRDMEQEAEPEGGEVANMYGNLLNKAEEKLYRMQKQLDDYDMNESVNEAIDGGQLFDYFANKGYVVKDRRPDGYPPKEGVEGYIVKDSDDSGKRRSNPGQMVIFQYNKDTDQFTISQLGGYSIDEKDAIKAGMREEGGSSVAGMDYYITDGNYTPVDISAEGLKDIVDHVMGGLSRESKRQSDYYKNRGPVSGIGNMDERISSAVKEKLTKKSSVEDHVEDFKDSDAPQFKGKSLKKIKQMALASFLSKQKK